ncbi:MAG: hypothetical protein KIS76_17240 [Pyrinomonadaceae bacterium]|nr:hypothetical protein [Pyrinomonadaceae bacterium]
MQIAWYDIIGTLGVATIIITYVLLQSAKIRSEQLIYSVLNAAGAGMIAFSLLYAFNLAAFIVEVLWFLISLYGIGKYFVRKIG